MHPVVLCGAFHEQEAAMPECNLFFLSIYFMLFVPEFEVTLRTETDRSDHWVSPQLLLRSVQQNRLTDFEPVRLVNSVKQIELTS